MMLTCALCEQIKATGEFQFRSDIQQYRRICNQCQAWDARVRRASAKIEEIPPPKALKLASVDGVLSQDFTQTAKAKNYKNTLFVSDLHFPFAHPDALEFLVEIQRTFKLTRVVCLGDIIDWHGLSRFMRDPRLPSVKSEYEKAIVGISRFFNVFYDGDYIVGNHDHRPHARALEANVPDFLMKDMRQILNIPKEWAIHENDLWLDENTIVRHGDGLATDAIRTAIQCGKSIIIGDKHTRLQVQWHQSDYNTVFGMNCACLVDPKSQAFAYGKKSIRQPVIGTGIMVGGMPMVIKMALDKSGRWTGKLGMIGGEVG